MSDASLTPGKRKAPWHLWVVAVLALLWNLSGAYTILMARAGRLSGLSADEAAYYAAQPFWFAIVVDVALFAPIAGAVALLLRHRSAVWLFGLSLVAVLSSDIYDLAAGTSRALANNMAMIVTGLIALIALLQLLYARAMKKREVLS
jgi:hypothetical protein